MKIAVFGSKHHPIVLSLTSQLISYFKETDIEFIFEIAFYKYIISKGIVSDDFQKFEGVDFEADLVLSFGGDGTFLKTASLVGKKRVPILGINTGRLGFLTNFSSKDIEKTFQLIKNREFDVEERSLLEVTTSNGNINNPFALNEVAIMKQDSSAMISIHAMVNGQPINTYRADGLIVSTPTGSTAYSLSVGGPLVVPEANNFIISPIASHSLYLRPLIIPDSWILDLEITGRGQNYLIALDGRSEVLPNSTTLQIKRADYSILIAKQIGQTFFDTLKSKLMWGIDVRE